MIEISLCVCVCDLWGNIVIYHLHWILFFLTASPSTSFPPALALSTPEKTTVCEKKKKVLTTVHELVSELHKCICLERIQVFLPCLTSPESPHAASVYTWTKHLSRLGVGAVETSIKVSLITARNDNASHPRSLAFTHKHGGGPAPAPSLTRRPRYVRVFTKQLGWDRWSRNWWRLAKRAVELMNQDNGQQV